MGMNAVDVGCAVIVLLSIAVGAWRGFLYEVLSLAGWVVAFFAAKWFAADVARMLPMAGASEGLRYVVAFVGLFVATAFAAGLVSWLIRKLAVKIGLRPVDRTLGAVFGMVRAALVLLVGGFVVSLTPWAQYEIWTQSVSGPVLLRVAQQSKTWLPSELVKVLP